MSQRETVYPGWCDPQSDQKHELFQTDDSAIKVDYLVIQDAEKWIMPIRSWKVALNRFMIEFEGRLAGYV